MCKGCKEDQGELVERVLLIVDSETGEVLEQLDTRETASGGTLYNIMHLLHITVHMGYQGDALEQISRIMKSLEKSRRI